MTKNQFIKKNYRGELITTLVAFLTALILVYSSNEKGIQINNLESWFSHWIDPIFTVTTLFIAGFLWWDSKDGEWLESLEKRLTVHFKHGDHYVLSCYNARLIGEYDIRAFGQQLGQQMNDNRQLKFFPGVEARPIKTIKTGSGQYLRYYEVEMQLKEVPSELRPIYRYWLFLSEKERNNREQQVEKTGEQEPSEAEITKNWMFTHLETKEVEGHPDLPHPFDPASA
jgi:hypothetical protein